MLCISLAEVVALRIRAIQNPQYPKTRLRVQQALNTRRRDKENRERQGKVSVRRPLASLAGRVAQRRDDGEYIKGVIRGSRTNHVASLSQRRRHRDDHRLRT